MVKFIVEVDDSFIEEHADIDNLVAAKDSSGASAMKKMLDCIIMASLKKKSEDNEEVHISTEFITGDKEQDLLTNAITGLYTLSIACKNNENDGSN